MEVTYGSKSNSNEFVNMTEGLRWLSEQTYVWNANLVGKWIVFSMSNSWITHYPLRFMTPITPCSVEYGSFKWKFDSSTCYVLIRVFILLISNIILVLVLFVPLHFSLHPSSSTVNSTLDSLRGRSLHVRSSFFSFTWRLRPSSVQSPSHISCSSPLPIST